MVAIKLPKVIGGGTWLIYIDILDPEVSYNDGAIYYCGTSFDKYYNSGLGGGWV